MKRFVLRVGCFGIFIFLGACNGGTGGGGTPGNGNLPPAPPSVTVLTAEHFQDGVSSLTLPGLSAEESVAVIPVYGTQDISVPSIAYSLAASGLQSMPPSLPQGATAVPSAAELRRQARLELLEQSSAEASKLRRGGARTLAETLGTQDLNDNCPAPYTVGVTACDFYVRNSEAGQTLVDTTLRFESENAYWFVDNRYAGEFTDSDLAYLAQVFESEVVPVDTGYFGNFPDFDGNGKIFIVFSSFDLYGYVTSRDFFDDDEVFELTGQHGNEGDIFYAYLPSDNVRFNQGNPNVTPEQARANYFAKELPSTLVHELKHLIAFGIRLQLPQAQFVGFEAAWAEEASAVAAEELTGKYGSGVTGYAQSKSGESLADPEQYRVVDDDEEAGPEGQSYYGYNFLLLWRIAERVGHENFWRSWTAGPEIGIANIEKNAPALGSFADMMTDWAVTLMFDHTGLLGGYDYAALNLRDGSWQNVRYKDLLAEATGETRSLSYYVGRGDNRDAVVAIRTTDPNPYVAVVRFTGELPY